MKRIVSNRAMMSDSRIAKLEHDLKNIRDLMDALYETDEAAYAEYGLDDLYEDVTAVLFTLAHRRS